MASLSFTDKFAWYGLRENPTYEQLLHTVRKPTRIPIPSREAKWHATSIYRSFLLDAQKKYHDYQQEDLDYDHSGSHLSSAAARGSKPSTAGDDPAWQEHDRFNRRLEEQNAYELAFEAMNQEHREQANNIRRQQLSTYGPSMVHPTLEAHDRDLEDQNIPHPAPVPRPTMPRMSWPASHNEYIAAGHPQAQEFPTFEQLNMGQAHRYRPGRPGSMDGQSYQTMRRNMLGD